MIPATIPFLEVSGTPHTRGWTIGHKFSQQIQNVFRYQEEFIKNKKKDVLNPERVDFLKNYAEHHFPDLIEEIRGMAEGADVFFRDLLIHNFRHSFLQQDHCSSIIIRNESHLFLGHNEDCSLTIAQNSYLILYDIGNGTKFLAYTYAGSLAGNAWGFNNHGMIYSCNYLRSDNIRLGCPRLFLDRKLLEAKNLTEALAIIQSHSPRAGVFSYNIISQPEMKTLNVESDTDSIAISNIDNRFFHTNHYIHPKYSQYLQKGLSTKSSLRRFARGQEILSNCQISQEGVLNHLWDSKIRSLEVDREKNDGLMTANTPVFTVTKGDIHLEVFNPSSSVEPCFKCNQEIFS